MTQSRAFMLKLSYTKSPCCLWNVIEIYFLAKVLIYSCVTQLKLYTLDKLSSTLFCCLCVCVWGIGVTRQNLHFFNIYRHKSPFWFTHSILGLVFNYVWVTNCKCSLRFILSKATKNDKSKISAQFFRARKGCQIFHLQILSNIVATDCGAAF